MTPAGESPVVIGVRDGRIASIEAWDGAGPSHPDSAAAETLELGADVVLLPGLVDSHVHVCEPGNTEWEGFATATRAAAAGGVTTIVDMPLDSLPSTVDVAALEIKRAAAAGQCLVDVGFWGGVVPDNLADLAPLRAAGVAGFKCFLGDAGTPDFPSVSVAQLTGALHALRDLDAPLLVHAELPAASAPDDPVHTRHYADYLASRPRGRENLAIAEVIEAARNTGGRAHIAHLSSSDAVPMIATAKREGVRLTAETCPHYLTFAAEEIADGDTAFKCGPPIREAANRELLWAALGDGVLEMVVSDHSPCTVAMKGLDTGDFSDAWGGVSSLQLGLAAVWTGARQRGFSLADVVGWMARGPADLAGLSAKGRLVAGAAADFAVFDPEATFTVDPAALYHRHPLTPYAGRTLTGVVRATYLEGRPVDAARPAGRFLTRPT